jgi:hypothetical protein
MLNRHSAAWLVALLLIVCLLGGAGAVDIEAATLPPPPPQPDNFGAGQLLGVLALGLLFGTIFVIPCLLAFVLVLFLFLKFLGLIKVRPTVLVGYLMRRVMSGGLKTLFWQLWMILALPAAWAGTALATRIMGLSLDIWNRLIFVIPIAIAAAAAFVALSGKVAAGVRERLGGMGGMAGMMGGGMRPGGGMKQAKPTGKKRKR